jgi:hypothetical protein
VWRWRWIMGYRHTCEQLLYPSIHVVQDTKIDDLEISSTALVSQLPPAHFPQLCMGVGKP